MSGTSTLEVYDGGILAATANLIVTSMQYRYILRVLTHFAVHVWVESIGRLTLSVHAVHV